MVKARAKQIQKKLQKLRKSEQAGGDAVAPTAAGEGPAPPRRVQQKLTKKVKFLQRVAASKPAKLAVKGKVGKKKRGKKPSTLADLSTLMEGLQSANAELEAAADEEAQRRKPGQSVGSQRARARVLEQEAPRLHQVLHHPQFLADPLAAVRNHLAATLPAPPPLGAGAKKPRPAGAKVPRSERKRRQKANRAAAARMQEGD